MYAVSVSFAEDGVSFVEGESGGETFLGEGAGACGNGVLLFQQRGEGAADDSRTEIQRP